MVSWSMAIQPILQTYCVGCHSGSSPNGGVQLGTYAGVSTVANNGKLYGVVARLPGYVPMPLDSDPLPACEVALIGAWVNSGAPNN
jgi:hypothetical protein